MSQIVTAIFEGGVFKPDSELELGVGTRVHLVVTPLSGNELEDPVAELDRLCDDEPIDSGGFRMNREQLHDRP